MQINLFVLQTALQLPNDLIPKNDHNPPFPNTLTSLASWIKALKAWNLRQLNDTSPAPGLLISISDIRTNPRHSRYEASKGRGGDQRSMAIREATATAAGVTV